MYLNVCRLIFLCMGLSSSRLCVDSVSNTVQVNPSILTFPMFYLSIRRLVLFLIFITVMLNVAILLVAILGTNMSIQLANMVLFCRLSFCVDSNLWSLVLFFCLLSLQNKVMFYMYVNYMHIYLYMCVNTMFSCTHPQDNVDVQII